MLDIDSMKRSARERPLILHEAMRLRRAVPPTARGTIRCGPARGEACVLIDTPASERFSNQRNVGRKVRFLGSGAIQLLLWKTPAVENNSLA